MVYHIILADILLIARIFPRPFGARKNTTQLAKYPRVLYDKPSNKMYILIDTMRISPSLYLGKGCLRRSRRGIAPCAVTSKEIELSYSQGSSSQIGANNFS